MQIKVARQYPRLLTVSSSSKRDIVEQLGIEAARLEVVPVGADHERFRALVAHVIRAVLRVVDPSPVDVLDQLKSMPAGG